MLLLATFSYTSTSRQDGSVAAEKSRKEKGSSVIKIRSKIPKVDASILRAEAGNLKLLIVVVHPFIIPVHVANLRSDDFHGLPPALFWRQRISCERHPHIALLRYRLRRVRVRHALVRETIADDAAALLLAIAAVEACGGTGGLAAPAARHRD